MNRTLTLTGLSLKKIFFNLEKDIYTCLVYYPPVQSATLHNQDCTILDLIEKDIIKHQDYGNIMLCGDFNARVGCENYCITKDNNNFNPSFDCYVSDSARPRMSQDKITDTRDNHLIDICVGNQLRILNGIFAGDSFGKFSYHTYNGSNTVDYVIVSEPLLFEIPLFNIANFIPTLSDTHWKLSWEIKSRYKNLPSVNTSTDIPFPKQYIWDES
jgi:hypothetical protein